MSGRLRGRSEKSGPFQNRMSCWLCGRSGKSGPFCIAYKAKWTFSAPYKLSVMRRIRKSGPLQRWWAVGYAGGQEKVDLFAQHIRQSGPFQHLMSGMLRGRSEKSGPFQHLMSCRLRGRSGKSGPFQHLMSCRLCGRSGKSGPFCAAYMANQTFFTTRWSFYCPGISEKSGPFHSLLCSIYGKTRPFWAALYGKTRYL